MDKATKSFLCKYSELQYNSDTGKVKCTLSGHEMPCRLEQLQSYVKGKKFTTLKSHLDFDFQRLEPLIVASVKRKKQLFCTLTNRYINRKPGEVKGHISGKRYKSALEKYNAGELEFFKERLRKPRQDEANTREAHDTVESEDHTQDENVHTRNDKSPQKLNRDDSEECGDVAVDVDDDDSGDNHMDTFWAPGKTESDSENDTAINKLDSEFCPSEEHDVVGDEVSDGGDEEEKEEIQREQRRPNRKRKAKLALLQSIKRTKVQKSKPLKTKSRKLAKH